MQHFTQQPTQSFARTLAFALAIGGCTASLLADGTRRDAEEIIGVKDTPALLAVPDFKPGEGGVAGGQCPQVISTYTNASFEGGQYIVQAGFSEGEIAATSYTLNPGDFPLRIDLIEMIFATSSTVVATTTKWSVMVWQGTPATGTLAYIYSSDGTILPHIQMSPGTNGTNVQFGIDPSDPEQMVIVDDGSHTFSVGFRIDEHNNQTQNPCLIAPPSSSNAFPTTDVGGLASPGTNWLYLLDCGALGCPAGWKTFAQLPVVCRPSGDWVMRVTWTPQQCEIPGACCLPNGTCQVLTDSVCVGQGGTFGGEGSQCTASTCAENICPCCFPATGGCVTLSPSACQMAGGIAGPTGQSCTGYVCFPTGACCLPDGSCVGPVSPEACAAQGGVFQGNATVCTANLCPEPLGAACFPTGFCLQLTEAQAADAGAVWAGPNTTCADTNGNGTPDACEVSNPADLNGDGIVNSADLTILLNQWGTSGSSADLNGDGTVGSADLSILLSSWG
ncbi:MAG: Dockerin type domain [Planctomycetota bacterium]